jgi:hypothetical protein
MALRCDPAGGVRVPLVLRARECPETRFDVLPATLVLEGVTHRLGDERAASPRPHASVELLDELVFQTYVQTHGHSVAHSFVRRANMATSALRSDHSHMCDSTIPGSSPCGAPLSAKL